MIDKAQRELDAKIIKTLISNLSELASNPVYRIGPLKQQDVEMAVGIIARLASERDQALAEVEKLCDACKNVLAIANTESSNDDSDYDDLGGDDDGCGAECIYCGSHFAVGEIRNNSDGTTDRACSICAFENGWINNFLDEDDEWRG